MHYAFLLICSFEMNLMALLGLILGKKNIKNYQAVEYYKKNHLHNNNNKLIWNY